MRRRKVPRFMGGSIRPSMEICGTSGLPILMVPHLQPKQWSYEKEATGMESSKMYYRSKFRYRTYQCGTAKYPVSWGVVYGPEWKYAEFRAYQSSWYRVCTKAMVISKGSYGHGEFKNDLPKSVQIPYLPVRGRKVLRFMGGSIGP